MSKCMSILWLYIAVRYTLEYGHSVIRVCLFNTVGHFVPIIIIVGDFHINVYIRNIKHRFYKCSFRYMQSKTKKNLCLSETCFQLDVKIV